MDKIFKHPYLIKVNEWIQNSYVITGIAMVVVLYGSLMAPRLPLTVAQWFGYSWVKMIIIFLIVMIHRINPMLALLIAVAFLLSIQTLSLYQSTMIHRRSVSNVLGPSDDEQYQITQELNQELIQPNSLHPRNRPTDNTLYQDNKVYDPDDPSHPGWKIPSTNTAVYELNPPYASKGQPETCTTTQSQPASLNQSTLLMGEDGSTRYSASHGYANR